MPNQPGPFAILNDNIIPSNDPVIASLSHSFIIYEVIRVINGKCLFLEDHLNRLFVSLSLATRNLHENQNDLVKNIYKLIFSNSLINGNIRLDVCFQQKEVFRLVQIIPHDYPSAEDYLYGVKAITYKAERDNPNAKILNPVLREKISLLVKNANAWEALLVDHEDQITEGSKSNVFAVKGNIVITPPVEAVLPGVTRNHIVNLCKGNAINIVERNISYSEINQYDSFFITGTSPKVLPLKTIDNISFDVSNSIMKALSKAYDNAIFQYIEKTVIPDKS